MTAENTADTVIKQATEVIAAQDQELCTSWTPNGVARALHAAGLLADPADRDDAAEDLASVKVEVPLLRARLKRVEAERDQLRRWKAEAIPAMFGLQDLGKALGVRLGTRITGEAAAEQARALKAERDHAQEVAELAEKDRRTYHRDALRAEAEVARLKAGWCPCVDGRPQDCTPEDWPLSDRHGLPARLRDALAERDELEHRLACLLCELTGGRMSKTNYDVHTMVCEVEAYFERTVDDEVAELRATIDRVATLRDRWAILAGQAMDADNRAWLNAASKTLRTVLAKGR